MADFPAGRRSSSSIICSGSREWTLKVGQCREDGSMNITTFAAIYIGSYEISMKIFELSAKRKIREVDYIRKRVELGKDAYAKGYIGYELAEELCSVLSEYT